MTTLTPMSVFQYVLCALKARTIHEISATFEPRTFPEEIIGEAAREFAATLLPSTRAAFNGRFERGINLAKQGAVSNYIDPYEPDAPRLFEVKSANQYRSPFSYIVDLVNQYCECPDHNKGHFCKHRVAANIIEIATQKTNKAMVREDLQPQTKIDFEPKPEPKVDTKSEPEPKAEPGNGVPKETDPSSYESIIWAVIRHNGKILGVEVINIEDETATVRALPEIKDGKKLLPQFPFPGGKCMEIVPKDSLFHVKVFQHQ
jgi:hypothetical protein